MSQVFNLSFVTVIYGFLSIIPLTSSSSCATFLTNDNVKIPIPENFENPGTWKEVYNNYSNKHIVNISLTNSQGIIRLCYLADKNHNESKCESYDSESLAKLNPVRYDVAHLYSVACRNEKNQNCDLGKIPEAEGKCAILYQDEECHDSNFASIPLPLNANMNVDFTIINSNSSKVAEGHAVRVTYTADSGNEVTCSLSKTSHYKPACDFDGLFKKNLVFQCVPDKVLVGRRFHRALSPRLNPSVLASSLVLPNRKFRFERS